MRFTETELQGAFVIDIDPLGDERGFFARSFCRTEFERHGLNVNVSQCNIAYNHKKGTLRGMHYQEIPYQEAKLVRCTMGSIFDVIIDLRRESQTYGKWIGVELSWENRRMLYVPEGFAHGYQTLEDDTEIFYQVSERYHPASEGGVRWDDPAIGIKWPEMERIISDKDMNWPDFKSGFEDEEA